MAHALGSLRPGELAHLPNVADTNSDPKGNHQLVAFRIQFDGTLADKRVLYDFGPDRRPIDGMAMDAAGRIYAAGGTGERSALYVFGPQGEPLAFVVPGAEPLALARALSSPLCALLPRGFSPLRKVVICRARRAEGRRSESRRAFPSRQDRPVSPVPVRRSS